MDHLLDSFVPWCPPKSESMVCHRYIPVSFTLVLFPSLSTYSVSFTRSAHILFPSLSTFTRSAHILFPSLTLHIFCFLDSLCIYSVSFIRSVHILFPSLTLHIFCFLHSLCTYSVSFTRSAHILMSTLLILCFLHCALVLFTSLCSYIYPLSSVFPSFCTYSVSFTLHTSCFPHSVHIVSFSLILFPSDSVRLICLYKER